MQLDSAQLTALASILRLGSFDAAAAALGALALGTVLTVWLAFGADWGLWPWELRLNAVWPLTLGVLATLVVGYLLSFCCGERKSDDELRGLVVGLGPLGCTHQS